jgi:hypothetical protein
MPATSKAQFRFMQGVAHGSIQTPGLSKVKAAEYVSGQSSKGLPEKSNWASRLKGKVKKYLGERKGK